MLTSYPSRSRKFLFAMDSLIVKYSRQASDQRLRSRRLCGICVASFYVYFLLTHMFSKYSSVTFSELTKHCHSGYLEPAWNEVEGGGVDLRFNQTCRHRRQVKDMQKTLTVAVLYYDDSHNLEGLLAHWSALPRVLLNQLVFLVIDDGSQRVRAKQILSTYRNIDLSSVRIHDDIPWNIGGARNLAIFIAPTKYILLMDVDVRTPQNFLSDIIRLVAKAEEEFLSRGIAQIYCRFRRRIAGQSTDFERPHPAVMLLSRDTYWKCGGCDEDFVGHYGFTDPHFLYRASNTPGVRLVSVFKDEPHISHLVQESSPAERVRDAEFNRKLFQGKRLNNNWSNEYIRFNWTLDN